MLLEKWTKVDPKAAIAYASNGNRGNDDRGSSSSIVLRAWARTSPDEALAWAEANGKGNNPQDGNWALTSVLQQLARTNVDRALEVASTQVLSRARGRMMETLVGELVGQRGEDAARTAILALPAGSFRDNMTAQIAGRLANSDGPGTAEWVMTLPPGEARSRALAEVVNQWTEDDPTAAGTFLTRLPVSPETDSSRERYAFNVLRADPEGALAWANTISNDEQRNRAIENLIRGWMRRDADGARTYLAQSQLPPEMKAQISGSQGRSRGDGPPGGRP